MSHFLPSAATSPRFCMLLLFLKKKQVINVCAFAASLLHSFIRAKCLEVHRRRRHGNCYFCDTASCRCLLFSYHC